ncbi:MAG: alpha/beta fold hydrolase [Clostridiales bacterium]|nr:alpha/beta fold hydrolase [Clostridiales bacterium]
MADLNFERVVFDAANGNGAKIAGRYYPSSAENIKGVIQICHGMAEYLARYKEMIAFFNDAGYHVCGMDMPGHGDTYELNKDKGFPKGYFGKGKTDADDLIKDVMELHRLARVRFGEKVPHYLYGHSMGSAVVRTVFSKPEYSCEFSKFVFSSTMGPNPAVGFARFLAACGCLFGGAKKENALIDRLAFGSYCKHVENPQSPMDWLSTEPEEVRIYNEDPMCGFSFTSEGYGVLFKLIGFIQSSKAYQDLSGKPCLFTYGEEDPVGSYGKGVRKVILKMRHHGARAQAKCYGPYRHEIQHEPVRKDYFRDVVDFLEQ